MNATASRLLAPQTPDQIEDASNSSDLRLRLRAANEFMARALCDDGHYEIAFFCECGQPDCHLPVWLTATEFQARANAGQPILNPRT